MTTAKQTNSGKAITGTKEPVTKADFAKWKQDIVTEVLMGVKTILLQQPQPGPKKWLKTYEVRKILGVCPATLQSLRDDGTIPYSRLGRNFYYDPEDVQRELERRRTVGRNRSGQFTRRP